MKDESVGRTRYGWWILLLLAPLLAGQEDCQPDPAPDVLRNPLALDCTLQGTDFYLPVDLTVQRERVLIIAGPGFFADVTASVLLPSEAFCPFVGPGNPTAIDVTSATMTVQIDGVSRPIPPRVTLSGSALPTNIDVAAACGGAYGAGIQIDFGTETVVPWPDGAATVDFFVEATGLDIGVSVSGSGTPVLSLPLSCVPQDRSVPPNGTTNDPEDSPRIVVDENSDGTYDRLATAADQIRINVNGYCLGYPCDDGNECTEDYCDFRNPYNLCIYTNVVDGTSCDAAGVPGMCSSGVCEQLDLSLWDPPDRDLSSVLLAGQDTLVGSGSTFEVDFYRNPAYACGLSGKYTFLVIEPRDNPGGEAPLWVYLHGGGVGYYDDQGVYHATLTQTEDTWNHEESLADLRDFRLPIAGNGQLRDNTRGRRMAEGYRVLSVSMCDHDLYGGIGTPYPNNPNPGAEVNGLEATMAAVEYTVANYPTTHVFAHGTSAGSNGVYFLSYSFADVGVNLTGAIMDSTFPTPRYFPIFDAFVGVPGFTHPDPGFDIYDAAAKIGFFGDVDLGTHTEAQVNAGFTDVPLLVIGGDVDPFCGGNQAPIAEATAAGLNNCDWYYDGVRQAVAAQPGTPHQVSILDGVGHVPTHDVGSVASDIVDTFIGDILAANPPQPFITGLESLFIGHSFFRPVAYGLPLHTTQAAISVHSQSVVSAGGANGAPEALWNDPVKRAEIQAVLDTGTVELFGMTYSQEYPTTAGYELWMDYALSKNPNTAFFLGLPWPDFPESYADAAAYASFWTTGHDTEWHALIDTLRGLYPGVEIFCIPYGQSALELRSLFEAGNLPDVTALVSTTPDSIFADAKGHGHPDGILHDLAELVWLNAIYGVDLTTYGHDPGYITDLKTLAKSIMDGHDPAYNANLPIAQ